VWLDVDDFLIEGKLDLIHEKANELFGKDWDELKKIANQCIRDGLILRRNMKTLKMYQRCIQLLILINLK
jgi:hypothetical protein